MSCSRTALAILSTLLFASLPLAAQQTLAIIDVPSSNQTVSGGVWFSGWALDTQTTIAAVSTAIDGGDNTTAQYGNGRDDVCNIEGWWAGCPYVGWSAWIDTTQLSDGPHALALTAVTSDGRTTTIYTQFTSSNSSGQTAYEIVNKLSAKVLDVTGASPYDGTIIQQWDFNGGGQQKWVLVPVESPYYEIVNQLTGKCLDITGVSTSDGAIIQQWDCLGGDNQKWQFVPSGGGYFCITSKLDGKVFEDSGGATTNGSYIQQWDYWGGDNQQWLLAADGSIPIVQGSTQSTLGQTSDGSVSGLSILSISGGTASTYSATELDYAASLYYDPYTAGFLFDNGAEVNGNGTANSGTAPAALGFSAPVYPWHDYQVESDHYVIAWFAEYGEYWDPYGYSTESYSDDGGGDVTWDPTGIAILLLNEYIYLGSTIADQTYVPQDQLQSLPVSDSDNTVYVPSSGIPTFTTTVNLWLERLKFYFGAVALATATDSQIYGNQSPNRVPLLLTLARDEPCILPRGCLSNPERDRTYILKDSQGRPWITKGSGAQPILINEAFTWLAGTYLPAANGSWTDSDIYENGGILDGIGGGMYPGGSSIYLQRYYASLFNAPAGLFPLSIPGLPLNTVPLIIQSPYTPNSGKQGCTNYATQLVQIIGSNMPTINGDSGTPTNPSYPICH